jgi:hypothetical protein
MDIDNLLGLVIRLRILVGWNVQQRLVSILQTDWYRHQTDEDMRFKKAQLATTNPNLK